jgi:hypothetical protein
VDLEFVYRFPRVKDASWNSYERQLERFQTIEHLLPSNSVGAEVGVYKGGFAEFLRTKARLLYLVDPWYRLTPFWGNEKTDDMSTVAAFINILTVYRRELEAGSVMVIPDFGANFLSGCPEDHFDWIYLDASHRYEQTLAEIKAARRCIKSDGVLIGDDYDPDPNSRQHGVYRAVNEYVAEKSRDSLVLDSRRQWAIRVTK